MYLNSNLLADMSYKIILIGDSSVGKSALIHRFKHDTFYDQSKSTIGVEFTKRIIKFEKANSNIQIHLWDTAGQERYKSITKQHYRGTDGALVIFDFSQPNSFESVLNWCNEIKENTPPECILCLVGNKADLFTDKSKILSKKAYAFAQENHMLYFETSSRWSRNEIAKDRINAKGIEMIILDVIENISYTNPRKSLLIGNENETTHDQTDFIYPIPSSYPNIRIRHGRAMSLEYQTTYNQMIYKQQGQQTDQHQEQQIIQRKQPPSEIIKLNDSYFQNLSQMNSPRMTTSLTIKKIPQGSRGGGNNNNSNQRHNELCNCI